MFKSPARLAIVPTMDILELDDRARLNTPGTVGSPNWEWRMKSMEDLKAYEKCMQRMITRAGR